MEKIEIKVRKTNIKCQKCGYEWYTKSKLRRVTCPSCGCKTPNTTIKRSIKRIITNKRAIIGLEAAIVLIAFVIIAAAFAFMVINQGLFATERGKTVIEQGLKQSSTPLIVDGTIFVRATPEGRAVNVIIIPLKAYGVKYVSVGKGYVSVTIKVGQKAWADIYGGVLYMSIQHDTTETITLTNSSITYYGTLTNKPIVPGTFQLNVSDASTSTNYYLIVDNGQGTLSSSSLTITSSSIDYSTGAFNFTLSSGSPSLASSASAAYQYITEGDPYDPSGTLFDDFVGIIYNNLTGHYCSGQYTGVEHRTAVVMAIGNSNGDEALDVSEKGYLILTLANNDIASCRDQITVEIRLEESATLSIEFRIPGSMPPGSYVPILG